MSGDPTPGALEEDLEALLRQDAQNQAKVSRQFTDLRYGPTYESTQPAQTLTWKAADALCAARSEAATLQQQLAKVEAERDEARSDLGHLSIALTGLTAGGSEFFSRRGEAFIADAKACVDQIRARRQSQHDLIMKAMREAAAAEARAKAAEAETARMREALTPFADQAECYDPPEPGDNGQDLCDFGPSDLQVRHLRAARAALSRIQNDGGSRG